MHLDPAKLSDEAWARSVQECFYCLKMQREMMWGKDKG